MPFHRRRTYTTPKAPPVLGTTSQTTPSWAFTKQHALLMQPPDKVRPGGAACNAPGMLAWKGTAGRAGAPPILWCTWVSMAPGTSPPVNSDVAACFWYWLCVVASAVTDAARKRRQGNMVPQAAGAAGRLSSASSAAAPVRSRLQHVCQLRNPSRSHEAYGEDAGVCSLHSKRGSATKRAKVDRAKVLCTAGRTNSNGMLPPRWLPPAAGQAGVASRTRRGAWVQP